HLVGGTATLEQALTPLVLGTAALQVVAVGRASDAAAERLSFDFCGRLVHEARGLADFVVIDSPPITAVVDALPLAKFVDDVVIVSRLGVSKLSQIAELYDLLMNFGTPPLGFVLVGGAPSRGSPYYSGSGAAAMPEGFGAAPPASLRAAPDR
ncbi:MAG TPA: hypothetical protein VGF68_17130, partial [Solirubrobacteraceae bacterium]